MATSTPRLKHWDGFKVVNGVVKTITSPWTGGFVSRVHVSGKDWYFFNTVYRTYNSAKGNELLMDRDTPQVWYPEPEYAEERLWAMSKTIGLDNVLKRIKDGTNGLLPEVEQEDDFEDEELGSDSLGDS